MLRPSLLNAGLDPDNLPAKDNLDIAKDINADKAPSTGKLWKEIWSAGHTVSGVEKITTIEDLVTQTEAEYKAAKAATAPKR